VPRIVCISFLSVILAACSDEHFQISPGIIELCVENSQPRLFLKGDSTTIPLNQLPWESFGFLLQLPDDKPRQVSTVHYLPSAPKQLGKSWRKLGYSPADAVRGMESEPVEVVGGRWFTFGTDPDDPIGTYRITILIDGIMADDLNFEIVPGGDPDAVGGDPTECSELHRPSALNGRGDPLQKSG
jgi:hypothetical protein